MSEKVPLRLQDVLPDLSRELEDLLREAGEPDLASQVARLEIVDRCRCGEESCASFYTRPKPSGAFGPGHRNVVLNPATGMLILDVVSDVIAQVEVLDRDDVHRKLVAALP